MFPKEHHYSVTTHWSGNRGTGTSPYRAYGREHEIDGPGKLCEHSGVVDAVFPRRRGSL